MKQRVLFTGALGHVGRHVIPLLDEQCEIYPADIRPGEVAGKQVITGDLCDFPSIERMVVGYDAIIHSAIFPHQGVDENKPEEFHAYNQGAIEVNCLGTYNLFEAAKRAGVKKIINISSLTVFLGKPSQDRIDEKSTFRVCNVYACTKLFTEHLGHCYADKYKMNIINLRLGDPCTIAGAKKYSQTLKERGCITLFDDVAQAISLSLTSELSGVHDYNVVTPSDEPWIFDEELAKNLGFTSSYVITPTGVLNV